MRGGVYLPPPLQTTGDWLVLVQEVRDALIIKHRVFAVHIMPRVGYNYWCDNIRFALPHDGEHLTIKLWALLAVQQQNRKIELLDVGTTDVTSLATFCGGPYVIENVLLHSGWSFFPRSWAS